MLRRNRPRHDCDPQRATAIGIALLALSLLAVACGGGSTDESSTARPPSTTSAAPARVLKIVALGDSETTGSGDPTGLGWVERYARLVRQRLHARVDVSNLAQDGKTSDQLLADVRGDRATRREIQQAAIVLFGVGGADYNAADAAFQAGRCRAEACYAPVLRSFARNFDATVAAVRRLSGFNRTVLRAITQPNVLTGAEDVIPPFLRPIATRIGSFQARTADRAICRTMAKYGGRCINLLRAFNGPAGTANAYQSGLLNHQDCCYPSARGQQLMAEMLISTGLAPYGRRA